MKESKKLSKQEIVDLYMNDCEINNKLPKSIIRFCEKHKLDQADFTKHFDKIIAVETYIFELFYENTIQLLYQNEAFKDFAAQDKVLSFYYTFFELLNANKSFVHLCLNNKNRFSKILVFKDLREQYIHFVDNIDIDFLNTPLKKINTLKDKTIANISWIKLILTIEYWLKDKSPNYEKTDVLIEKSVHTAFQLMDTSALNSAFDLAKFIAKDMLPSKKH